MATKEATATKKKEAPKFKSEFFDLEGKAFWTRIRPDQRDFSVIPEKRIDHTKYDGIYQIVVEVDEPEALKVMNLPGNVSERILTRDKDGKASVRLNRKHLKVAMDGTVEEKGPPKVYDQTGKELDINTLPDIGNGTPVRVRAFSYEYAPKNWSTQLLGVQIDMENLVEYKKKEASSTPGGMGSWTSSVKTQTQPTNDGPTADTIEEDVI